MASLQQISSDLETLIDKFRTYNDFLELQLEDFKACERRLQPPRVDPQTSDCHDLQRKNDLKMEDAKWQSWREAFERDYSFLLNLQQSGDQIRYFDLDTIAMFNSIRGRIDSFSVAFNDRQTQLYDLTSKPCESAATIPEVPQPNPLRPFHDIPVIDCTYVDQSPNQPLRISPSLFLPHLVQSKNIPPPYQFQVNVPNFFAAPIFNLESPSFTMVPFPFVFKLVINPPNPNALPGNDPSPASRISVSLNVVSGFSDGAINYAPVGRASLFKSPPDPPSRGLPGERMGLYTDPRQFLVGVHILPSDEPPTVQSRRKQLREKDKLADFGIAGECRTQYYLFQTGSSFLFTFKAPEYNQTQLTWMPHGDIRFLVTIRCPTYERLSDMWRYHFQHSPENQYPQYY
ncbi:hypothetical protein BLNAU_1395 [Blattamonas nauphoetae]|uniref:Uncharacterized protein n=1 Tax=Blattamonas nauphoetae TaxID=2049346 RepID=A0ABQ9YJ89_9EUKA|nr:hypothetical protein BLNAU_1395 [Blattamonas nauphoetae]